MAKKSKRVASRQAQLSGRGKRLRKHGPRGFEAKPYKEVGDETFTNEQQADHDNKTETLATFSNQSDRQPKVEPNTIPQGTPRRLKRRGMAELSPEPHFKQETIRIGIITGIILGLLTVLTIVI